SFQHATRSPSLVASFPTRRSSDLAQAAYYNQYETIAGIPSAHECTAAQGFAAGSTYLNSVKIGLDDTRSLIYRTNKNTGSTVIRSEEHTSELQSRFDLVCRLLLEK